MNVKLLIGAIAIFGIGFGAGYVIRKKQDEKIIQDEIDDVKYHMNRYLEAKEKALEDRFKKTVNAVYGVGEKGVVSEPKEAVRTAPNELSRPNFTNKYEQAKRDYAAMFSNVPKPDDIEPDGAPDEEDDGEYNEDEDEELRDAAGFTERELNPEKIGEPYLIESDSFNDDFEKHDKITLYYYRYDDTLSEENEEVIDDVDATVGLDALAKLDMQTSVWVRNERLGIDYEIISVNASYSEKILGIRPKGALTPREQYLEKQKKRELDGE